MNSLDIIKQELIKQKELLDQKGFPVEIANTNPSPTEITTAISNIQADFTKADATVNDVALGKTFFAQTGELKTGTLDVAQAQYLSDLAIKMIIASGSAEIYIPSDSQYDTIRDYAYYCYDAPSENLFYKHNLTIPDNIKTIGIACFNSCNLTGKVTVPASVSKIGANSFRYTNIDEIELSCQNLTSATYVCAGCTNLKKATVNAPIEALLSSAFFECTSLEEVYLPSTLTSISSNAFYKCANLKLAKFNSATPCTVPANLFYYATNVVFLVPYQSYDAYLNATNFQYVPRAQYGFGDFVAGNTFPSSVDGYTITWYASVDEAKSGTNPITVCQTNGTYYGAFTATT